jgi:hypothetical protein
MPARTCCSLNVNSFSSTSVAATDLPVCVPYRAAHAAGRNGMIGKILYISAISGSH